MLLPFASLVAVVAWSILFTVAVEVVPSTVVAVMEASVTVREERHLVLIVLFIESMSLAWEALVS